jgi:hypothetical protein
MKRIYLMMVVAVGLLVPSAVFVGQAGADNPHGPKGDPTSSCGGSSGGKPSGLCENAGLPQSNGCNASSSPHNPHCTPTTTPSTPTVSPPAVAAEEDEDNAAGEKGKKNQPAGAAARPGAAAGEELAFTGSETLWLALLGAAMLTAGLVFRARAGDSA